MQIVVKHRAARRSVAVVEEWQSLMNGGDRQGSLAVLSPDLEVTVPASLPHGGTWRGRAGFVAMLEQFRATWTFDGPLAFELKDVDDDLVVVHATGNVRSQATDRPARMSTAEFLTIRDEQISHIDVYYADTAEIVAAVSSLEVIPGGR